MLRKIILLVMTISLAATLTAYADWDASMPAKWVQMPDETPLGIDVNVWFPLADDFECRQTGPITDIHIWGSWDGDYIPGGDPGGVMFFLSIHEDIPADASPTGYSMPGDTLWTRHFHAGEFTARQWTAGVPEGWMDPNDSIYYADSDTTIWQYNFHVPEGEQFVQTGTPSSPVTYWLQVKVGPTLGLFGWKTSRDHWNDDAVWGDGAPFHLGPWYELTYPSNHEYAGQPIDLAFVIAGEEEQTWKWLQGPDLSMMGIDVNATEPSLLADDYLCTETGRVTGIWVWGSWLDDYMPQGNPYAIDFTLSFHADIPAGQAPDGYSIPGETLWHRDFLAGDFDVDPYAVGIVEGYMFLPDDYVFPADTVCWLYKFDVSPDQAFFQGGTPDSPVVYWLDLQAHPHEPNANFGWKTSLEHWNDDAVWGAGPEPYTGPWYELRYPIDHQYYGESMDLAFRLTNDALSEIPESDGFGRFRLYRSQPNPFYSSTAIRYNLVTDGLVKIQVFDVTGREVNTLVDAIQTAGPHSTVWSGLDDQGSQVPPGIYFCRLTAERKSATQKVLYLQ